MELIPGLPEELELECLTRLHYTTHQVASQVSQQWRDRIKNPNFYFNRKRMGYTHKIACLVQSISATVLPTEIQKSIISPSYGITVFDSASRSWERLNQVPKYPNGLPLFCQLASTEGKLIMMGGWESWDPVSYNQVEDVFIYDFVTRLWLQGKDMPSKRSFFAIGAIEGCVYIAGGHDEHKHALRSVWVYDVRTDHWSELTQMSQDRDECEGVVMDDEFWVVSGYGTNSQGMFEASAESYQLSTGTWNRVDQVWKADQCPRSCVGVSKNRKFVSWAELDSAVRVGTCGVELGGLVLLTGSAFHGAPNGFFMVEMNEEQNGKMEKINVPDELCGFVQSGCCVEI